MARGTVKWFDDANVFGFIQRDDGPDVLVNGSSLVETGLHSLTEGQPVEFEIAPGSRGPQAKKVRPL